MPIKPDMQERLDALDYDHCLKPEQTLLLPNGSVLMFSPDGSGNVHFYENPLLDHIATVKDDSDLSNQVKFKVSKTGYGISIALLDEGGNAIAEVSADFFENQFSVIAHDPKTFDGQDPVVKHCLIADVRAAVQNLK